MSIAIIIMLEFERRVHNKLNKEQAKHIMSLSNLSNNSLSFMEQWLKDNPDPLKNCDCLACKGETNV